MNQTNTTTRYEIRQCRTRREHNAALRRRNHEKTQKKKLDICENHLFGSKERGKNDV